MAEARRLKLSYNDYVRFPEHPRRELIDGEALVAPSPNIRHQRIVLWLAREIAAHLDARGGGEVLVAPCDVVLDDYNVVQPDVVFVSEVDAGKVTETNVRGAPSWVIEVLSDAHRDRVLKRQAYERAGVPEYWIVDPEARLVEVYRPGSEPQVVRTRMSPTVLPGLEMDLSRAPWG